MSSSTYFEFYIYFSKYPINLNDKDSVLTAYGQSVLQFRALANNLLSSQPREYAGYNALYFNSAYSVFGMNNFIMSTGGFISIICK